MYEVKAKKKITMCFTADSNQGSTSGQNAFIIQNI